MKFIAFYYWHLLSRFRLAGCLPSPLTRTRLRLKKRMEEDLRLKFCKIWSEERETLLDSVKDSPEMTTQILMELKDARSYRVAAQRARAKTMPKIPKEHDDMDPEKVPPHFWPFLAI